MQVVVERYRNHNFMHENDIVGMGSNKNKRNHRNNHRHVFKRRWHAEKYRKHTRTHVEESGSIDGSRIVNLEKLQEYINTLTVHAAQCGGEILLAGEKRDGLASIISTRCSQCNHRILLETSRKVKGPRGYRRWECNLASVWGQMSTGGGHSKLQETMGVLGIPVMSARELRVLAGTSEFNVDISEPDTCTPG